MDIRGNVFLITGGASGLGAGTARMLAQAGGTVVLADLPSVGNVLAVLFLVRGGAAAVRQRRHQAILEDVVDE